MKFVIQRVTHAEVAVEGEVIGKIGKGFMALIGVAQDDTRVIADKMVKKLTGLRIFEDENGKTNLALKDVVCDRSRCHPQFFDSGNIFFNFIRTVQKAVFRVDVQMRKIHIVFAPFLCVPF